MACVVLWCLFSLFLKVLSVQVDFKSLEYRHCLVFLVSQQLVHDAKKICQINPPMCTQGVHGGIKVFKPQTVKGEAGLRMQQMEGVWDGGPSLCSQAPRGESPGTHLCFSLVDAPSLCLDLTVRSQSRPGQPWCEVQSSVDTKPFLQYDSDRSKVKPLGLLGEEVNATKA